MITYSCIWDVGEEFLRHSEKIGRAMLLAGLSMTSRRLSTGVSGTRGEVEVANFMVV